MWSDFKFTPVVQEEMSFKEMFTDEWRTTDDEPRPKSNGYVYTTKESK